MKQKHRSKRPDISMHITYQNVKDGIAGDPHNCTFGLCPTARARHMEIWADLDALDPKVLAEWSDTENGKRAHHRATIVRRHLDGAETKQEPLNIVFATDVVKKKLLRQFPKEGMDFWLVDHTVRLNAGGSGSRSPKPGETPEEREERLVSDRARRRELAEGRLNGTIPPAPRRIPRIRARFGGQRPR